VDPSDGRRELLVGRRAVRQFVVSSAPAVEPPAVHAQHPAQAGDAEPVMLLDQARATCEVGAGPKHNDQLEQYFELSPVPLVVPREFGDLATKRVQLVLISCGR
jgi:hypothetical protein